MLTSPALLTSAGNQGTSNASLSQLGEDYNRFLTLLTAQIQNQDPLAPVDSTEFVAQLAQLSQVEQAVQTNQQITTLTNQVAGLLNLGGTDLIGRDVKTTSNMMELVAGQVRNSYATGEGAVEVEARITDPLGRVVRTLRDLPTTPFEEFPLEWDGLDDMGVAQLDGNYTVSIVAVDSQGASVDSEVSRIAEVQEVIFQQGEILFTLSGNETVSSVTILSAL